jgi:cobalamin biosynthesis protein CobT
MDAVESSTKVFGRKESVRVIFEGSQAETDGDTVVLPALPPGADITVDQADVIRGFRDHESMHVRCTDTSPAVMSKLNDISTANKHHGTILQYCEDTRIEHAGIQEYAGMKHTLSATQTHAAKLLLQQLETRGKPEDVICSLPKPLQFRLMLSAMSRSEIGVESGGVFETLCQNIRARDPQLYDLAAKYAKKMTELPTGYDGKHLNEVEAKKGTEATFALAEEIFTAFQDYSDNPPPPPQQGKPQQGDGEGKKVLTDEPPPSNIPPKKQPDAEKDDQEVDGKPEDDGKHPPKEEDKDPADGEEDGGEDEDEDASDGDGDGSDGDGEEEDEDDGDQGSGDSDSDDSDDDGDDEPSQGSSGEDAPGEAGDSQGAGGGDGDAGDEEHDLDADNSGDKMEDAGTGGNSHGNGMPVKPPDPLPDDIDVSGIDVDDLAKKALDDVVSEINQEKGKPIPKNGRAKGLFNTWSKRLSMKVPAIDGFRAAHGYSITQVKACGNQWFKQIEKAVTNKKAMIRRILELELMARSDRHWESGHKSGRLQSIRLVQAIQGRETVYQKRQDGKDMDTLLYISIDGSGSMGGTNAYESATLAYALSEALERTGCDIEVSVWGNIAYYGKGAKYNKREVGEIEDAFIAELNKRRHMKPPPPARYVSMGLLTRSVVKYKRDRTTNPDVRDAFGMAALTMNSGTPSFDAIFADLSDMAKENHSKKIYLHLTDGDSDYTVEGQDKGEVMKEAHQFAKSIGVHMIGLGIGGMHLSHMFPDYIEVSGSDAYEPVIRHLAKLIAKESGHVAGFKRA